MSAKTPLLIVGAGGFAREVLWLQGDCENNYEFAGFLADNEWQEKRSPAEGPVVGAVRDWVKFKNAAFVIGVGSPRLRRQIVQTMQLDGSPDFARLVHPSVRQSRFVELGEGAILAAGCILTTRISIGRHVILNLNVTVGHDCSIGDFVTVAPMVPISGAVTLEDGVEIGTGACIKQGVRLGRGSMAGMGAVVIQDVQPNKLVVGSPAAIKRDIDPFQ